MLSEVGQVRDSEGQAPVEKTEALVEAIVAVAYRRGLPWAVMEMHKFAPTSRAGRKGFLPLFRSYAPAYWRGFNGLNG